MTDVRLVGSGNPNHNCVSGLRKENFQPGEPTTDVRLVGAAWDGANDQISTGIPAASRARPALLISYFYWDGFAKYRPRYAFRDYMLDSGAFSAKMQGTSIDLGAYIDFCLDRQANDPQCAEIVALDVIGDPEASRRNTQRMLDAGVRCIPVYHYGEPESLLREYAAMAPKLSLGGMAGMKVTQSQKVAWLDQVFARVWPKKIHGLGMASEALLMRLPFHSVDATNWILGPAGFGGYKSMGKPTRAPRGKAINLRAEVEWWLALERRVKQRWAKQMAQLEAAA